MKHSPCQQVSASTFSSVATERLGWSVDMFGKSWTAALPAVLPEARLRHIAAQGQHPGSSNCFGTIVCVAHVLKKSLAVESIFDLSMPISAFTRLCEVYERAVAEECARRDMGASGSEAIADFIALVGSKFWDQSAYDGPRFELPRDLVPAARRDSKENHEAEAREQ